MKFYTPKNPRESIELAGSSLVNEVRTLINEKSADIDQFKLYYRIEALEHLTRIQAHHAIAILEKR